MTFCTRLHGPMFSSIGAPKAERSMPPGGSIGVSVRSASPCTSLVSATAVIFAVPHGVTPVGEPGFGITTARSLTLNPPGDWIRKGAAATGKPGLGVKKAADDIVVEVL